MAWTSTNSEGYPAPAGLAVDVVAFTVRDGELKVLALSGEGARRLPGGFVGPTESPAATARRHLAAKTGVEHPYLEQLGAFAEPGRDPRGWIPTISYLAVVPADTSPIGPDARWVNAAGRHRWKYDHRTILADAVDRLEGKLWWSNVAVGILPLSFTMSEARAVYEAIAHTRYDPATFARDLKATGLIEPTGEVLAQRRGRPAATYRFVSTERSWGAGRRKRVHTN